MLSISSAETGGNEEKNTDGENSFNITRLQIFMHIAGKKEKIEIPSIQGKDQNGIKKMLSISSVETEVNGGKNTDLDKHLSVSC